MVQIATILKLWNSTLTEIGGTCFTSMELSEFAISILKIDYAPKFL